VRQHPERRDLRVEGLYTNSRAQATSRRPLPEPEEGSDLHFWQRGFRTITHFWAPDPTKFLVTPSALCSRLSPALLNIAGSRLSPEELPRWQTFGFRTRRQPELADDNDPLSPSMNTRVMR